MTTHQGPKRPLLATEHTDFDSGAERVAFALAKRCGVPLASVLPFTSNPEFEVAAPEYAARVESEAADRAERVEAAARAAGVDLAMQVRGGPEMYVEIVDEARAVGADLIVIRRRGRRGFLASMMLGEVVSKVIAHAPCNVLVVARAGQPWRQRVLVAVDPQAPWMGPVHSAAAVAMACDVPLTVLSVAHDESGRAAAQGCVEAAARHATDLGARAAGEVRTGGKPGDRIVAAASEMGADLIVVGRHGGESGRHAWIGGVTQKVIGHTDCPVLVHVTGKEGP